MRAEQLIHQLQLERGCSCAWISSCGNLEDFESLVIQHRTRTTALLEKADYVLHHGLVHVTLMELRANADNVVVGSGSTSRKSDADIAHAFYRLLAGYTDLIARIIEWVTESEEGEELEAGSPGSFKRGTPPSQANFAFTTLKEAMSIERAIVCGVLCLPDGALPHLPQRAFADFVLCMEKQKAQKAAVRAFAPPQMLHILSAAFELHPDLDALQETLLNDFDVIALRRKGLTVQAWWQLITTHINRMHELQVLFASAPVEPTSGEWSPAGSPLITRVNTPRSSRRSSKHRTGGGPGCSRSVLATAAAADHAAAASGNYSGTTSLQQGMPASIVDEQLLGVGEAEGEGEEENGGDACNSELAQHATTLLSAAFSGGNSGRESPTALPHASTCHGGGGLFSSSSPAPPPANHQSSPIKLAPSDVRALSNLPAAAIKQALLALLDDPSHQLPTNGRQRWSSAPVAMTSASIAAAINADPMTAARPTPKHTPASASLRPSAEEVEEEKDDDEDDKVQRPPSPSKHPELHTGSPSRARRVLAPASAIREDADDEEEDRQSRRTTVELDPSDWSAKAPPGAQMSYDVIEQAGANGYHQQAGAPEGTTPAMLAPTDWPGSRAPSASSVLPDVANGCQTRGAAMGCAAGCDKAATDAWYTRPSSAHNNNKQSGATSNAGDSRSRGRASFASKSNHLQVPGSTMVLQVPVAAGSGSQVASPTEPQPHPTQKQSPCRGTSSDDSFPPHQPLLNPPSGWGTPESENNENVKNAAGRSSSPASGAKHWQQASRPLGMNLEKGVQRRATPPEEALQLDRTGGLRRSGQRVRPLRRSRFSREEEEEERAKDPMMISLDALALSKRVGTGGFSTTYRALWTRPPQSTEDSPIMNSNPLPLTNADGDSEVLTVAVKVASCTDGSLDQWRMEVRALASLNHPNIVRYLGYVASPPNYCLVLEFCEEGDLHSALRRPTPPNFFFSVSGGVAAGLGCLHERRLMHRDIKSANVLMARDSIGRITPKLTDFGVAVELPDRSSSRGGVLTAETGTYRWMAPEVIRHQPYSTSADIYSTTVVLYELITHELPWASYAPMQVAAAVALEDKRPPLPPDLPPQLYDLVTRSWSTRPADRPSAKSLQSELELIKDKMTPVRVQAHRHLTSHLTSLLTHLLTPYPPLPTPPPQAQRLWIDAPRGHPPSTDGSTDPPLFMPPARKLTPPEQYDQFGSPAPAPATYRRGSWPASPVRSEAPAPAPPALALGAASMPATGAEAPARRVTPPEVLASLCRSLPHSPPFVQDHSPHQSPLKSDSVIEQLAAEKEKLAARLAEEEARDREKKCLVM